MKEKAFQKYLLKNLKIARNWIGAMIDWFSEYCYNALSDEECEELLDHLDKVDSLIQKAKKNIRR